MGITSHELHKEFPEYKERINQLKASDEKFSQKLTRYTELDQEIEGLEKRDGPISDDKMHRLKQWRAQLKDELYSVLTNGK